MGGGGGGGGSEHFFLQNAILGHKYWKSIKQLHIYNLANEDQICNKGEFDYYIILYGICCYHECWGGTKNTLVCALQL